MMADQAKRRRFVNVETMHLGRFLAAAGDGLVGWRRTYKCECGATFTGAGEVWDHVQEHEQRRGDGQGEG
jgi:hypothetical protein